MRGVILKYSIVLMSIVACKSNTDGSKYNEGDLSVENTSNFYPKMNVIFINSFGNTCTIGVKKPDSLSRYTEIDSLYILNKHNASTYKKFKINFPYRFMDQKEVGENLYVLTTDVHTMKKPSIDYLSKYDANNNLVWTKNIAIPKVALQQSFLYKSEYENELIYITNFWKNEAKIMLLRKYDLDGNKLVERKFNLGENNDPKTITSTGNNNFIITSDISNYDHRRKTSWIAKFNINADTLWTKTYNNFYPKKSIQLKSKELLFFGEVGYSETLKLIKSDSLGTIIWEKEIDGSLASDIIQIEKDGNYLLLVLKEKNEDQSYSAELLILNESGTIVKTKKIDQSIFEFPNPSFLVDNDDSHLLFISREKNQSNNDKKITHLMNIKDFR